MERLAEDASRFALKQDAARQGSMSKEERDAAWRAARVLLDAPQAQHAVLPAEAGQLLAVRPSDATGTR